MAVVEDLNGGNASSSPSLGKDEASASASPPPSQSSRQSSPPPISSTGGNRSRLSVHRALGGGTVADVVLWRRRNAAALVLAGTTASWCLLERAGYSFLSLIANALLLLVTILFFWARSASLLNRPLPPLPNLEISDKVAEKLAGEARVWFNRALAVARGIALGGDRILFLKVILVLWAVSYIGSFFNFLTLVYIGVVLSFMGPALYDKYQDHIDEKLCMAHGLILNRYQNILSKTGRFVKKEKKTD